MLTVATVLALVGIGGVAVAVPHTAHAQEAAVQRQFSIPAGKLSDVLAQFAVTAGVQLSFHPPMLAGLQSDGLQGSYTVAEGFSTLLANTEFQLLNEGRGNFTLRKISTNAIALPSVKISSSVPNASTEATRSYTLAETSTATKLKLTPRQTPQIVNSVTHQMMDDFAMQDMEDVLMLVPGVSTGHTDGDRRSYTARSYAMAIQYDGLPSTSGIDGGVVAGPDSALIDRTEVLLGATGLMNGAGQPGGVINMVYKRPTDTLQASSSISVGSWDAQRIVADISGPLTSEGGLRGRVVAVDNAGKSFRNYEKEKKKVFYAVVDADLTDSTLASVSIQKQDIYDNVTDRSGLPVDNDGQDLNWNQSTFLAPAWNQWNKYATTYKIRLEQKLSAGWQLTLQGSQLKSEADWLFGTLSSFDSTTGDAVFSRWGQYNQETSDDVEFFLSGPVALFGRGHEVVIGGNWTEQIWNGRSGDGTDYATNLYTFNPQTSVPRPEIVLDTTISDLVTEQYGGYAAGHFDLTHSLNAIIGSRVSWYHYEYNDTVRDENAETTPYFGLIYDLGSWASAYVSYSNIFNPQTVRDTNGNTLEPELGANYEAGIKGEFYKGKLNASLAIFNIVKDNEAELISSIPHNANNACGGWCYAAKGETTTKGFDLGLSGQLTDAVQVMAGFTRYEKDDNEDTVHITKLSGSYAPTGYDWRFGGSIDVSSKTYGQWGMTQDARTLVGVFGKYQLNPQLTVALNIHNLLDEAYYANAIDSGYGRIYWGEPRSWALSFQGQW